MYKTISFISGKGGSGKTTLALSIAVMLSECGVKTLLVDCDLSTNGATYFYEDKLNLNGKYNMSFYDVLFNEINPNTELVSINPNYDFMPSISLLSKSSTKTYLYTRDIGISSFFNEICRKYDVILFDCQAGYTDILKFILPHSDINLMVMEPDAISSAAMRSLYLKIGNFINDRKMYQVFNKASNEEYEIYSKVSGGTVFTNIETVVFDWKIRKAFSVSQIPDMKNTSANYGQQVFNICSILLTDNIIQNKLKKYESFLQLHAYCEKENDLESRIRELNIEHSKVKRKKSRRLFLLITGLSSVIMFACLAYIFEHNALYHVDLEFLLPLAIVTIVSLFSSFFSILDVSKETREYETDMSMYKRELRQVINNKNQLEGLLEEQQPQDN